MSLWIFETVMQPFIKKLNYYKYYKYVFVFYLYLNNIIINKVIPEIIIQKYVRGNVL